MLDTELPTVIRRLHDYGGTQQCGIVVRSYRAAGVELLRGLDRSRRRGQRKDHKPEDRPEGLGKFVTHWQEYTVSQLRRSRRK